ncbi:Hypothetical predicted protein [Octopus vulgaris]|uniref:Uncharacterized protein n=1 Tax=Octopus vulgaris TaxID=6645 RepID=A0AA36F6V3_OCTVU|nr:Hypothetical predicted protein [Octopus vulgaris]
MVTMMMVVFVVIVPEVLCWSGNDTGSIAGGCNGTGCIGKGCDVTGSIVGGADGNCWGGGGCGGSIRADCYGSHRL